MDRNPKLSKPSASCELIPGRSTPGRSTGSANDNMQTDCDDDGDGFVIKIQEDSSQFEEEYETDDNSTVVFGIDQMQVNHSPHQSDDSSQSEKEYVTEYETNDDSTLELGIDRMQVNHSPHQCQSESEEEYEKYDIATNRLHFVNYEESDSDCEIVYASDYIHDFHYNRAKFRDFEHIGYPHGSIVELGTDNIQDLIAKTTLTVDYVFAGKIAKFVYVDPGDEYILVYSKARSCVAYMHLTEKEKAEAEGRDKIRMVFIFQDTEFLPSPGAKQEEFKEPTDQHVPFRRIRHLFDGIKLIEVYRWPGEVDYAGGKTVNGYSFSDCIIYYLYLDPSNAWTNFVIRSMSYDQLENLLWGKFRRELLVGRVGHWDRDELIKRCWQIRDKIYEDLDAFTRGGNESKIVLQDIESEEGISQYEEEYETEYETNDDSTFVFGIGQTQVNHSPHQSDDTAKLHNGYWPAKK